MFILDADGQLLACHFLFLSLCFLIPNTGAGGIKEERGLKKRWEMKRDNDRLTDTTAQGALSPSSSQSKAHETLLDEVSFKRGMPEQRKINWAIVNRLV